MRNSNLLAASAIAAFVAGVPVAHAADVVDEIPVAPAPVDVIAEPSASWSGLYAGVTGGYGWGTFGTTAGDIDSDGFNGGIFGGYNYQNGNIVVGGDADVGYSWADGASAAGVAEQGWNGALRARFGYALDPVLLYAAGGVAMTQGELSDGLVTDDNTHFGWTIGAGAEALLTENIFSRVEYRYTDYGSKTYTLTAPTSADLNTHEVRFGVGMKF